MTWLSNLLSGAAAGALVESALTDSLPRQKWYAHKGAAVSQIRIRDAVLLPEAVAGHSFAVLLVDVGSEFVDGQSDCYVVPVASRLVADAKPAETILQDASHALVECSADSQFWRSLLRHSKERSIESLTGGSLSFVTLSAEGSQSILDLSRIEVSMAEQSNTAVTFGDWGFLKLFRRVEVGLNPDVEIGQFLTRTAAYVRTPRVLGSLDFQSASGSDLLCLGVLLERVAAKSDAWQFTLDSLAEFWQRVAAEAADWPPEKIESEARASSLAALIGPYLDATRLLGQRTAEMHSALAAGTSEAFRPEPLTALAVEEQRGRVATELAETCRLLRSSITAGTSDAMADELLAAGNRRLHEIAQQLGDLHDVLLIRVHGDYHLGQVLRTRDDFVIIDFEGEPDRPLAERREKRCAAKDVAGMIRSLHYASNAASVGLLAAPGNVISAAETWQRQWYLNCRAAFLSGYQESLTASGIVPEDSSAAAALLDLFVVEKVLYELRYEIHHRPDWVAIPLAGLQEVLGLS